MRKLGTGGVYRAIQPPVIDGGLKVGVGSPRRGGFTLTEILVAITIMLMVTAAAIPVVLPALEGRRAREAARTISVALDTARSKAMETGRPVGLMFERVAKNPHFCQSISYCEVPEPYSGDTQSSSTVFCDVYPDMASAALIDPVTSEPYRISRIVPNNSADSAWLVQPGTPTQFFGLRPGDLIQFGNNPIKYRLEWEEFSTTGPVTSGSAAVGFWSIGRMLDVNPVGATDNEPDTWYMDSSDISPPAEIDQVAPPGIPELIYNSSPLQQPVVNTALSYRVARAPVRSTIPAVQLPEGMVIDLMCSGVTELKPWSDLANTSEDPLRIEDAYDERDDDDFFYPLRTSEGTAANDGTTYLSADFADSTTPTQPLTIMFGPDGALTRFYHWERDEASGLWTQVAEDHQATLYMLVARREQMPTSADLASAAWPTLIPRDSWRDTENLWVMVNSGTGKIDIQPVSGIRQGGFDPKVQDDFGMTGANPRTLERLYLGVWLSRAGCREAISRGGQ